MTEGELIGSSHRHISRILNLPREEGCFTLRAADPLEFIAVVHDGDRMRALWFECRGDELFIWRAEHPGSIAPGPRSLDIRCTRGSETEVSGLRHLQREYRERHSS